MGFMWWDGKIWLYNVEEEPQRVFQFQPKISAHLLTNSHNSNGVIFAILSKYDFKFPAVVVRHIATFEMYDI